MESSECLLTSNSNNFLLKLSNFAWKLQMQVNFFLQIIFYKNRIFKKTIFLLNHTSWGYFLDYMNLPYQFGILRMCTFCWFDWFLSKPSIILVIHTNTCALFFSSDLNNNIENLILNFWTGFNLVYYQWLTFSAINNIPPAKNPKAGMYIPIETYRLVPNNNRKHNPGR